MAGERRFNLRVGGERARVGFLEGGLDIGALVVAQIVCPGRLRFHGEKDSRGVFLARLGPCVNAVENGVDPILGHGRHSSTAGAGEKG